MNLCVDPAVSRAVLCGVVLFYIVRQKSWSESVHFFNFAIPLQSHFPHHFLRPMIASPLVLDSFTVFVVFVFQKGWRWEGQSRIPAALRNCWIKRLVGSLTSSSVPVLNNGFICSFVVRTAQDEDLKWVEENIPTTVADVWVKTFIWPAEEEARGFIFSQMRQFFFSIWEESIRNVLLKCSRIKVQCLKIPLTTSRPHPLFPELYLWCWTRRRWICLLI